MGDRRCVSECTTFSGKVKEKAEAKKKIQFST